MRGIPRRIQTRADLQNLFAMVQATELDGAELLPKVRMLLSTQYHVVPVLSTDGADIVTHYFPEAKQNGVTEDGLTIKKVKHIEDTEHEGEGIQYKETQITLSKAPENTQFIAVYMEDNFLTQNGFDIKEIEYILGVLDNA